MIFFGTNSAKNSISRNKEEYSVKSSLSFGKKSFGQILRKFSLFRDNFAKLSQVF
jgi:hypothetical protein